MSAISESKCPQLYNLFTDPLSSNQSTNRKIFNVVFHIFTLAIPYILFQIFSPCFLKQKIDLISVASKLIEECKRQETLSQEAKKALDFALTELTLYPKKATLIASSKKIPSNCKPTTRAIIAIEALYLAAHTSPVGSPTRETKDICMKLGFAVSCLTLRDLSLYVDPNDRASSIKSFLLSQSNRVYHDLFFTCRDQYNLRGESNKLYAEFCDLALTKIPGLNTNKGQIYFREPTADTEETRAQF
jgi:hypothetical protein